MKLVCFPPPWQSIDILIVEDNANELKIDVKDAFETLANHIVFELITVLVI